MNRVNHINIGFTSPFGLVLQIDLYEYTPETENTFVIKTKYNIPCYKLYLYTTHIITQTSWNNSFNLTHTRLKNKESTVKKDILLTCNVAIEKCG